MYTLYDILQVFGFSAEDGAGFHRRIEQRRWVILSEVGQQESRLRTDVAATYRLLHAYGFSDLTDGFAAGRLGPDEVVIGGYGQLPELVRASDLYRRPWRREAPVEQHGGVDMDALRFSRAAFSARDDWQALIHAHTPESMVFSALKQDLLPISQWGLMFHGRIGYLPFEYDVSSNAACGLIGALAKEGNEAFVFRNHGVLVPGRSMADAFVRLYRLEQAFTVQLKVLATGAEPVLPDPTEARHWGRAYWSPDEPVEYDGQREWTSLLAKLDSLQPDFRK
jgi:ribulose-5-phosphate 4-epimerase/fuculose-1-phosphate aldolase